MGDSFVIITIDGQDYYVEASRLNDIAYIDGKLVNVSNSTIYLVSSYSTETTYPRIILSGMQQGRYYRTYSSNYTAVTSNYTIKSSHSIYQLGTVGIQSAILFILIILLGVRLVWKR